jgi:hypothetical protein
VSETHQFCGQQSGGFRFRLRSSSFGGQIAQPYEVRNPLSYFGALLDPVVCSGRPGGWADAPDLS